jgi:hypothetical protein
VRLKHNANRAHVTGKRVVLVDDSIVRGTTSKKIVEMMLGAGATEVHMRISSPPTTHSCFYGIDTPERKELLASSHSVEEMAKLIGVDSLAFISIDGLYRAMGEAKRDSREPQFCDACFTGEYPTSDRPKDTGRRRRSCRCRQSRRSSPTTRCPLNQRLAGRIALVTGNGIGAAVAAFAQGRLVLVARPSATSRKPMTPCAPPAARRRWCRWISGISTPSTGWAHPCMSGSSGWMYWSAMRQCSAACRPCITSRPGTGSRRSNST